MDLDTHLVLYDRHTVEKTKSILAKALFEAGLNYSWKITPVLTSKHTPKPTYIVTNESETFEELEEKHFKFLQLCQDLKIRALVESELNYNIQKEFDRTYSEVEADWALKNLNTLNRESTNDIRHWGDIHLDIPVVEETKGVRETFDGLGYSFITTDRVGAEMAIITAQVKENDLLRPIVRQMCVILKRFGFNSDAFEVKAEKLLHFDGIFGAKPLPITMGIVGE